MKKLLTILGSMILVTSTTATLVACGGGNGGENSYNPSDYKYDVKEVLPAKEGGGVVPIEFNNNLYAYSENEIYKLDTENDTYEKLLDVEGNNIIEHIITDALVFSNKLYIIDAESNFFYVDMGGDSLNKITVELPENNTIDNEHTLITDKYVLFSAKYQKEKIWFVMDDVGSFSEVGFKLNDGTTIESTSEIIIDNGKVFFWDKKNDVESINYFLISDLGKQEVEVINLFSAPPTTTGNLNDIVGFFVLDKKLFFTHRSYGLGIDTTYNTYFLDLDKFSGEVHKAGFDIPIEPDGTRYQFQKNDFILLQTNEGLMKYFSNGDHELIKKAKSNKYYFGLNNEDIYLFQKTKLDDGEVKLEISILPEEGNFNNPLLITTLHGGSSYGVNMAFKNKLYFEVFINGAGFLYSIEETKIN
ncbi:lipoprotein [Spiroplasma endosymbiont of Othius punctulatus]|uniref:lipoprotein n=1 Tax=Spiroplasma endosymbiont of Othius punctulatus TaxID=3066289 RepID=UPI0030D12080